MVMEFKLLNSSPASQAFRALTAHDAPNLQSLGPVSVRFAGSPEGQGPTNINLFSLQLPPPQIRIAHLIMNPPPKNTYIFIYIYTYIPSSYRSLSGLPRSGAGVASLLRDGLCGVQEAWPGFETGSWHRTWVCLVSSAFHVGVL